MKIRFRGPDGGRFLELAENATIADLTTALESKTGLHPIVIKFGWPLQTLAVDQSHLEIRSLGLQRENLTVAPLESVGGQPQETVPSKTKTEAVTAAKLPAAPKAPLAANSAYGSGEDVKVEMRESRTNLVLRVMPDDGDCMFTAVGGALGGLVPAGGALIANYTPTILRSIVAETIFGDPIAYNANFLGAEPDVYCRRLLGDRMWGGGIELSILSDVFRIEIHSIDVKTGKAYLFGEQKGYQEFCIVMYSGIHYDRVVETATDGAMHMVDFDVARWDIIGNEHVVRHAEEICKILNDRHYYTSMSDFVVKCNNCQEILQGEDGIEQHARVTGHTDVTEIVDVNK
ncbi:hypothetical protein GGR50DRAFT_168204 [Xylaria sp. CBS 124048]|nr:hypothetical protein GGR50DRAFT_168204 [Xylaria sp. CBS 124048]